MLEDNTYRDPKYADTLIGKKVHIVTKCFKIDATGVIEKYDMYMGEIIYIMKAEGKGRLHIGSNSPELTIEVLD